MDASADMATDKHLDKMLEDVVPTIASAPRRPVSTYRLQFSRSFTFRDAARVVPYLGELGITDVYASPYLKARPGSLHGYDITDHNSFNPEVGTEEEYDQFVQQLQARSMGQILDFVPNHMGIFDNKWLADVLENGPSSPFATFFDINWHHTNPSLTLKLLLPILEDQYGRVLEAGGIKLTFDSSAFAIDYRGHRFPVAPETATLVLSPTLERAQGLLGNEHPDCIELQSITTACKNLPRRDETSPERVTERQREKEVVKGRLWSLCQKNPDIKSALEDMVKVFNGTPNAGQSLDRLHGLLEAQAYRLSYWRVAWDEINYRRFFDINELIALRMENSEVFDLTHQLLLQLLSEQKITGVRIDHVDGLFDPSGYLSRLQNAYFRTTLSGQRVGAAAGVHEHPTGPTQPLPDSSCPGSAIASPLFVIVEKILADRETLPPEWASQGTTGYEFGTLVDRLFVNSKKLRKILHTYRQFTGIRDDFKDVVYRSKKLIATRQLSAETSVLAHHLDRVSENSRYYRDFTLNSLFDVTAEVIACFPVYRTYVNAFADYIARTDRAIIKAAIAEAKERNPAIDVSLFDFLRDTLLLKFPPDMDQEGRDEQRRFVMHFQQVAGAVMAKGMEDTAFYIYAPLISLNEVGGSPGRFRTRIQEFHASNMERVRTRPHSLLSTSTHDSKRGEDVRARIDVLSEMPDEWHDALGRWSRLNRGKKTRIDSRLAPDGNTEYMIYQTLLGTYPLENMGEKAAREYLRKIQDYVLKALREAKVHTSWVSPNQEYEEAAMGFIASLLERSEANAFLLDFEKLNQVIAHCGMFNSLSQVVLKMFSPGIPDLYQGNEMWSYSLVDPDNRRPVDFGLLSCRLEEIQRRISRRGISRTIQGLLHQMPSGDIKLYVTWRCLNLRRSRASFFDRADYVPCKTEGDKKEHLCAFSRKNDGQETIIAAPRLLYRLTPANAVAPIGPEVWGNTRLVSPSGARGEGRTYRNIFTGQALRFSAELPVAELMGGFPVAVLESQPEE